MFLQDIQIAIIFIVIPHIVMWSSKFAAQIICLQ